MKFIFWGIICSSLIIVFGGNTQAQEKTDLTSNLVRYQGLYVFNIARCKPPMFEKVRWIAIETFKNQDPNNPKSEASGVTVIDGYIETIDDEVIRFKKGTLKKNASGNYRDFEFETVKMNGIHFTFKGEFLNKARNDSGLYTVLIGTLIKYKNNNFFAETSRLPYTKYAEM